MLGFKVSKAFLLKLKRSRLNEISPKEIFFRNLPQRIQTDSTLYFHTDKLFFKACTGDYIFLSSSQKSDLRLVTICTVLF